MDQTYEHQAHGHHAGGQPVDIRPVGIRLVDNLWASGARCPSKGVGERAQQLAETVEGGVARLMLPMPTPVVVVPLAIGAILPVLPAHRREFALAALFLS